MQIANAASSQVFSVPPTLFRNSYEAAAASINSLTETTDSLRLAQNKAAVLIAANAAFFYIIERLARYLDNRIAAAPKKLAVDEIRFNQFLINGVIVGGSFLTFNIAVSRLLNDPLSNSALCGISAGAVALRILLSKLSTEV